MRKFRICNASLTDGNERLLVNASNTKMWLGSGVSGAIKRACGEHYQDEIANVLNQKANGVLEPGKVLITGAGTHPRARYVAHVAVMDYRTGYEATAEPDEARILSGCRNLWQSVEDLEEEEPLSIAMVALGAGTGNFGARNSWTLVCSTLREHLEDRAESVIGDVTFYALALTEFIVLAEVAQKYLPIEPDSIPPEVREHLQSRKS